MELVESATREALDPAAIRRELAELSSRFDEGLISVEEFEALEDEIVGRAESRIMTAP